jgi:hypothetical protein
MIRVSDAFLEKARRTPVLKVRIPDTPPRDWSPFSDRFVAILRKLCPRDTEIIAARKQGIRGLPTLTRLLRVRGDRHAEALFTAVRARKRFELELLNGTVAFYKLSERCQDAARIQPLIARFQTRRIKDNPLATLSI